MRTGQVVRLVRAGAEGVRVVRPDGSTATIPAGRTAWVRPDAKLEGQYTVVIERAVKPMEQKA